MADIRIIASEKNWIEGAAIDQLKKTADLPDMIKVVGMPDLHPGKGAPVGATFITQDMIYPFLIGNDIGCGMGFWQTDLPLKKAKIDKWIKKLSKIETLWVGDANAWLSNHGVKKDTWVSSLGTIGGGNHFVELQAIETVIDKSIFDDLTLNENCFFLMVHSGSRGLGNEILRRYVDKNHAGGVKYDSSDGRSYLEQHEEALCWAKANRACIAEGFLQCIGTKGNPVLDREHNSLTKINIKNQECWIHRKGASSTNEGPIVIPGSRGAYSYLVIPTGDQTDNNFSAAHGAGRKWNRGSVKGRLEKKYSVESFKKTELGSRVICNDKELLYEEAPQAYKNIEVVVNDMVDAGFLKVVAKLRPVLTYKVKR